MNRRICAPNISVQIERKSEKEVVLETRFYLPFTLFITIWFRVENTLPNGIPRCKTRLIDAHSRIHSSFSLHPRLLVDNSDDDDEQPPLAVPDVDELVLIYAYTLPINNASYSLKSLSPLLPSPARASTARSARSCPSSRPRTALQPSRGARLVSPRAQLCRLASHVPSSGVYLLCIYLRATSYSVPLLTFFFFLAFRCRNQVAMMSPVGAPYTPQGQYHQQHLFVPTPSPLQYSAVAAANPNARNDFLATTSPLSYSSPPFPYPSYASPQSAAAATAAATANHQHFHQQMHTHQQVPTISVSMDDMRQQMHEDSFVQTAHTANASGLSPSPLSTGYYPYASGPTQAMSSSSTSPISHAGSPFPYQQVYARQSGNGEGESTPVTTLSGADSSQQARIAASQESSDAQRALIDKLRGVSPVTDSASNAPTSPQQRAQLKPPVESVESPFRIAAPQPRPGAGSGLGPSFSPLPPSSRPTSALGALSELAELASRQPTPSQPLLVNSSSLASPAPHSHPSSRAVSRPASALSTRSTASHAKLPKVRRRQPPPHRFAPSLLQVNLPYQSQSGDGSPNKPSTPHADTLARGPLEFEDEGPRYRTRSKLRILKAEMQEREREADLSLIRRGLRGGGAGSGDESGLDILASVSVTRRGEMEPLLQKRSESPAAPVHNHTQKAARPRKNLKRAFKELDDADCESVTTASECGSRTPSKRQRIPTEKAAQAAAKGSSNVNVKKEPVVVETRSLRNRSRAALPARPSPVRASSQKNNNAKKAAAGSVSAARAIVKSAKASPAPPAVSTRASAAKKGVAANKLPVKVDDDVEMDNGESELSSLSSMSETEEESNPSAGDTDYSPKKKPVVRSTRPSTTPSQGPAQSKQKVSATPIDIDRGAAAIPFPVRQFPADVPMHAGFPLLYRKFPMIGYTDPSFTETMRFGPGVGLRESASVMSSPLSSLTSSPAPANTSESTESTEQLPPPPSTGHFNQPRNAEDLYTPRFVRGVGRDKMGLCPICYESPERGGVGKAEWLSMKFSAFK